MKNRSLIIIASAFFAAQGAAFSQGMGDQTAIATVPGVAVEAPSSAKSKHPFYYDARNLETTLKWMDDSAVIAQKTWPKGSPELVSFLEFLDLARVEVSRLKEFYKDKVCPPDGFRVSWSESFGQAYDGFNDATLELIRAVDPEKPWESYSEWMIAETRTTMAVLKGEAKNACDPEARRN